MLMLVLLLVAYLYNSGPLTQECPQPLLWDRPTHTNHSSFKCTVDLPQGNLKGLSQLKFLLLDTSSLCRVAPNWVRIACILTEKPTIKHLAEGFKNKILRCALQIRCCCRARDWNVKHTFLYVYVCTCSCVLINFVFIFVG